MCFKWAVLSALHKQDKNAQRVSKYKEWENDLNFDGVEFPVQMNQIPRFESQNDISINVYRLTKTNGDYIVSPCHLTALKRDRHIHLLMVHDQYIDDNNAKVYDGIPKFHYVWIKNLSKLVSSQVS